MHIADPSRWVPPGSPLAAEAAARAKSLYLPTGVVPMFPRALAEGPFSLRPGLPTEAVSVGAVVGPDGALLPGSVEAVPSRITPARRLTYDDVDEMLDVCEESDEQDLFDLMQVGGCGWVGGGECVEDASRSQLLHTSATSHPRLTTTAAAALIAWLRSWPACGGGTAGRRGPPKS